MAKIADIWSEDILDDGTVVYGCDYMSPKQRAESVLRARHRAFLEGMDEFRAWLAVDYHRLSLLTPWMDGTDRLYPGLRIVPYITKPDELVKLRRLLGSCEKHSDGDSIGFRRDFDNFARVELTISKQATCELVDTGRTEMRKQCTVVTEAVVVEEMVEVPVKEWVCPPSLLEALTPDD